MRQTLSRLALLTLLVATLAACGSKGPLVMPSDEPAKPEQPAQ
ncbi:MAG: lipoprotein [Rhodanobacteraceae bacterium]|nr:lipoprotein [Rhodanobacteraceae bacterium]